MFSFVRDSEYREALELAREPIASVGCAYNVVRFVVRFQCPIEFLYELARKREIRSWGVVRGQKVLQFRVSILDVVAYGLRVGWLHQYSDLGIKGLVSEEQFICLDEAVKARAEGGYR